MNLKKQEKQLVEGSKDIRDQYIDRVEVLERVKKLNTLAGSEYMTNNQVAKFYEVKKSAIRRILSRHKDEFRNDGLIRMKGNVILEKVARDNLSQAERKQGYVVVDGERLALSENNLFPKRAVLRIGMLLRDSEVAKEVRTLLLNVYHDAEMEKDNILEGIEKDYDKEISLQKKLASSFMEGDMEGFAMAAVEVTNLLNKRIDELKPKAEYTDEVLKPQNLFTVTQIAKDLGMSARGLNSLLHALGVQYKQSGQWVLYSKYQNKGYTHSETVLDRNKNVRMITKWTQKGRRFIYEVLDKNGLLNRKEKFYAVKN